MNNLLFCCGSLRAASASRAIIGFATGAVEAFIESL